MAARHVPATTFVLRSLYSQRQCCDQSTPRHRRAGHSKRVQIACYNEGQTLSNMLFTGTWLKQRMPFITRNLRLDSMRLHILDSSSLQGNGEVACDICPVKFCEWKYLILRLIWDRL